MLVCCRHSLSRRAAQHVTRIDNHAKPRKNVKVRALRHRAQPSQIAPIVRTYMEHAHVRTLLTSHNSQMLPLPRRPQTPETSTAWTRQKARTHELTHAQLSTPLAHRRQSLVPSSFALAPPLSCLSLWRLHSADLVDPASRVTRVTRGAADSACQLECIFCTVEELHGGRKEAMSSDLLRTAPVGKRRGPRRGERVHARQGRRAERGLTPDRLA